MPETLTRYLVAFKKLKIDKAHGIAPHKPVLLLSVLQAYQNQLIDDNRIFITPELVALFKSNWSLLVTTNHNCHFALPFYHLTSDKFWMLIPKHGFENILRLKSSMRSFANLHAAIKYAVIENDLDLLMKDNNCNRILQQFLLDEYFPTTKNNTENANKYNSLLENIEGSILNDDAREYKKEIDRLIQQNNEEEIFLRSAIFKREIPNIYNHTCCISGMRLIANREVQMIDACHIVPFSESHDDTITNGISLSPNFHRAFDRFLLTIDEQYKIIVSTNFTESENHSITPFNGKQIHLPQQAKYYPASDNLRWHNERFGQLQ